MLLQQDKILSTLNKVLCQTPKLRKNGTQAMYFCPFCNHHKRKLEILLTDGKYHCWTCDISGLSIRTLLKKLNAPKDSYKIVDDIKSFHVKNTLDDMFSEKAVVDVAKTLPEGFKSLINENDSIEYKHAINYVKSRGISIYDIYRYNIGYCDSGEYKNRVIVPSYDSNGDLNFFSGRDFYNKSWLKYVNCTFSKNMIGFEMLVDFNDPITLVEGSFDAIAVRKNCVPLFGKTVSQKLKLKLLENKPPYVNIMLDNDALRDSVKICDFLIKNGIPAKLVKLEAKDPSILGFTKTWEYINHANTVNFDDLFKLKINL